MREPPPHLSRENLITTLLAHYGLAVADLTFLPLGHDAEAWVYRAVSDTGAEYFLKVRSRLPNEADLRVPRYLRDQGITQVVAPLATLAGALWTSIERYALILYPFVAGTSGWRSGSMSERQWREYGAILRRIHEVAVPPELERILPREEHISPSIEAVRQLDALIETFGTNGDHVARELAAFWRPRHDEIRGLVARTEELGAWLAQAAPPFVLTHGDIHTGNVQLDAAGGVWIVDWDETALAPKERDLMFVVGGIRADLVGTAEEQLFFDGYGPTVVDPVALAYYRYLWAVQEVGAFGEEALLMPDAGDVTRREALQGFMDVFARGGIVSIARASSLDGA